MLTQSARRTRNLALMALFTALTAIGAFIRIPLFTMSFTLQTLFTTLAGLLLGKKRGALSVGCYVLMGLLGLPVFTAGGGPAYVLQPTFGYLVGFVVGAYATGAIAWRAPNPSFLRLLLAGLIGMLIIYALGMLHYWLIYTFYLGTGVEARKLLLYCFALTVPGDVLSCALAAFLTRRLWPVLGKGGAGEENA